MDVCFCAKRGIGQRECFFLRAGLNDGTPLAFFPKRREGYRINMQSP